MPTPPASIWEQYSVVAIIVLFLVVLGFGVRAAWKELRTWLKEQDEARASERKVQREWETEQNRLREEAMDKREAAHQAEAFKQAEMWRAYFVRMQQEWCTQSENTNGVLEKLVNAVGEVHNEMRAVQSSLEAHHQVALEVREKIIDKQATRPRGRQG